MIHHSCPVLPPAGSVDRSQPLVDFITSSTHTHAHAHPLSHALRTHTQAARERAHAAAQKCTFAPSCARAHARTATELSDVTARQRWRGRWRNHLPSLRVASAGYKSRPREFLVFTLSTPPPPARPPTLGPDLSQSGWSSWSRLVLAPRWLLFF